MVPSSTKVLAKSKLQQTAVEENDEEDFLFGAQSESSEEDHFDKVQKLARPRAPAAKRAKTSSMSSPTKKNNSPSKQKNRQKKNLSLLPTMPLDVLFEIFGLLNPKDIINLARTSKLFRDTLMSPGATTVWKVARERLDAPGPPSDMSEPGWAALLFGNACQNCGAKNVQNVDFLLRRRLCLRCKKSGIVVESRLKKNIPGLDKSILDLIPHTDNGGWANACKSSRFFWTADVERMILKIAALEQTKDELEEFKAKRKKLVESVRSAAGGYQEWAENEYRGRQMDKETLMEKRQEAIYDRFLKLGYEKKDVMLIRNEHEMKSTTQVTERIWQRIRPVLEPKVQQHQKERLDKEMVTLRRSRRRIVRDLYQAYQRGLVPSQWKYLPRTFELCQLEPLAQLIDAPPDMDVNPEDFEHANEMLPELLSSLSQTKRKEYRDMLLEAKSALPEGLPVTEGSSSHQPQDPLELATSVFECHQRYNIHDPCGIVGVEDLMTHHCDGGERSSSDMDWYDWPFLTDLGWYDCYADIREPTRSVKFSSVGAMTASSLVQLAGLDPTMALAADMDEKDLRFSCRRCKPEQDYLSRWIADGYSWRRAISHDIRNHHGKKQQESGAEGCNWQMLSDTIAEELKTKERADSKWDVALWTCGHCSFYMTDQQCRNDIAQHLETEHAIVEPKEPDDIFMFERFSSDFGQRITYIVPELPDRCMPAEGCNVNQRLG